MSNNKNHAARMKRMGRAPLMVLRAFSQVKLGRNNMYLERNKRLQCLLPTRVLFLLTLVMAAATTFVGAPTAWAANVTCTSVMSGDASGPLNIKGNVIVPTNAHCTLSFVNVTGSVQAGPGSTLLITGYTEPSTIGGNVEATNCYSALLEGTVTVGGNVQILGCRGNGPNGFQGPDIVIKGNFQCEGNSSNAASCLAWLGKISGNVEIQQNRGPTASDVSLVTVGGNLICLLNSSAPTHLHGPSWVDGNSLGQCKGFATETTSISNGPVSPAESCAALLSLPASGFPVPNTVITSAVDTPASTTPTALPERCIVNGYINKHISPVDQCQYQDAFQVQLPLSASWNGRFMMQGGGGGEGSVPTATGTNSGSAGSGFGIINGYAVASQDGGHQNTDLAACVSVNPSTHGNANEYFLDPLGIIGQTYQSIEVTALTAKYLTNQYYGNGPNHSYWVGCSTGGRQGMVMSQNFPSFFDGIVAGDPVYDQEAIGLSETNGVEAILNVYLSNPALTPPGPTMVAQPAPQPTGPHLYPAFPSSDQGLFETALLQACDALDGVTDGVIDNLPACWAKFDPATATYTDYAGALGPANTTYLLQCTGAKNATCLSPAQIQAAKKINQGPRSNGSLVRAPAGAVASDPVSNVAQGYAYDGGWMTTVGIPARKIGSSGATSLPGDFSLGVGTFGYAFISPADPTYYTLAFNFNTDLGKLNANTPIVTYSTSLDIKRFVKYGHKIIWYHGASDPGPPVLGTKLYYTQMADKFGGLSNAQNFSRFYPVPNMDHCTGGATTDQFDMLTPVVNWVESGTAPGAVTAKGTNFNSATYQVVGNYITNTFVNAPTTRSRPLCPYPKQAHFTGSTTVVNGVPVAANPADLASAANYTCVQPDDHDQDHDNDHDHDNDNDHDHDHDRDH
jgi:feruloyl esterase